MHRQWVPAVVVCAALSLAGCGGSSPESPAPSASSSTSAAPAADSQALLKAGATASGAVPGATVVFLDQEGGASGDDAWRVGLATSDGSAHEVLVSKDGATVTEPPRQIPFTDNGKAGLRNRIQAAKLDYRAATEKVLAMAPGATIGELRLTDEDGRVVWTASIRDAAGKSQKLTVDATSG